MSSSWGYIHVNKFEYFKVCEEYDISFQFSRIVFMRSKCYWGFFFPPNWDIYIAHLPHRIFLENFYPSFNLDSNLDIYPQILFPRLHWLLNLCFWSVKIGEENHMTFNPLATCSEQHWIPRNKISTQLVFPECCNKKVLSPTVTNPVIKWLDQLKCFR